MVNVNSLERDGLRTAGKLEKLTHEMDRYLWNIIELCKIRWKNFSEMSSNDRHKVYLTGEDTSVVDCLDIVSAILG